MPNQPQITSPELNTPSIVYKPSELLGIIASYFSQQDVSKQVIFLQGIYWKNPKNNPAWAYQIFKNLVKDYLSEIIFLRLFPRKRIVLLKD